MWLWKFDVKMVTALIKGYNIWNVNAIIVFIAGDVVHFAHLDDGSLSHSPINTVLSAAGVKTVDFK